MTIDLSGLDLPEYVVFDPRELVSLLVENGKKPETVEAAARQLVTLTYKYFDRGTFDLKKDLHYYMIGTTFDDLGYCTYTLCEDKDLLITVFSKTVGTLYVPMHIPSYSFKDFNRILAFRRQELQAYEKGQKKD